MIHEKLNESPYRVKWWRSRIGYFVRECFCINGKTPIQTKEKGIDHILLDEVDFTQREMTHMRSEEFSHETFILIGHDENRFPLEIHSNTWILTGYPSECAHEIDRIIDLEDNEWSVFHRTQILIEKFWENIRLTEELNTRKNERRREKTFFSQTFCHF